jgi:ribosomal protein L2
MAVLGCVSNSKHKYHNFRKAGDRRSLGFRPKVRGVAKNPCDHPHGGGNGKKSKMVNPVSA